MLLNRIEEIREALAIERETLARAIGKSSLTLWRYEKGIVPVKDDMLHKIAQALNVDKTVLMIAEPLPRATRPRKTPVLEEV